MDPSTLARMAIEAAVNEIVSRGFKELEELYKGKSASDIQAAKENLKKLEKAIYEIENSREYDKKNGQTVERLKQLNKERDKLTKEYNLSTDEINYERSAGIIEALDEKAKYGGLSEKQKLQLAASKDMMHNIKAWDVEPTQLEGKAKEEQTAKANIAGINSKKKAQEEAAKTAIQIEIEMQRQNEERIKAEGKEFDDNMKKKEEAMKNLAEFDERMRISSLSGEEQKQAQLLANFEKQKAEVEAMHEAQLLYAEDDMALKEEQYGRLLEMEVAYQAEKDAISQEFAEMEAQRKLQADEAAKAMAAQRKREEEELRDKKLQATADSLNNMQQLFEGSSKYAAIYKASAIGEATINATQSVLKTMASVPYPFNVPLAALQSAVALQRVSKIASTKMYRGGMIPGMNTLLMANEQGREAILNTRAVRAVGGEAAVNALNRGVYNSNNSYDNRQSSTIVINAPVMTQKVWNDEIAPVMRRAERRR